MQRIVSTSGVIARGRSRRFCARVGAKALGRPRAPSEKKKSLALERLVQGHSVAAVARELNARRKVILPFRPRGARAILR